MFGIKFGVNSSAKTEVNTKLNTELNSFGVIFLTDAVTLDSLVVTFGIAERRVADGHDAHTLYI